MLRKLSGLFAAAWLILGGASALAQGYPQINWVALLTPPTTTVGLLTGQLSGISITSSVWPAIPGSTTDLAPLTKFVSGYTGDATVKGMAPSGLATDYHITAGPSAPTLSFPVTYPGFDTGGNPTTGSQSLYAVSWLRRAYSSNTLPSEATAGSDAKIALAWNDFVYQSDTTGNATALASLYKTSLATTNIPVTNNSTRVYPRPIGGWITEPGLRIGASQSFTVEFFVGHMYAQGGKPVQAVKFIATDSAGTHTVTKVISSMSMSARQLSFSCTGTNGSSVLTSCGSTLGAIDGMRMTVAGIPGQPKLLSHTSTSLTFGQTITSGCTTTLNSGVVSLTTTPGVGEAFDDGGFVGATITDANFTTPAGIATITVDPVAADITFTSGKATAVKATTGATGVTASANHTCTINHVFQGTTGAVTAYVGVPLPVFSATFAAADFTGASFADGITSFRAQALPIRGDVTLDTCVPFGTTCATGSGADGTGNDWQGAAFLANGTDTSPNLHNLWAFYDSAGKYSPIYAWVSGTAGGTPAVQSTSTDPGSVAYYANVGTATTALKAFNNARTGGLAHNDANGGIVCYLPVGSPYSGTGSDISAQATAKLPGMTFTQGVSGGTCNAGADPTTVALAHNASFNTFPPNSHFSYLSGGGGIVFQGLDSAQILTPSVTKMVSDFTYDHMNFTTPAAGVLRNTGTWHIYNSLGDGSSNEANLAKPQGAVSGGPGTLAFNTLNLGTYTTNNSSIIPLGVVAGNITWGGAMSSQQGPETAAYFIQPTAYVIAFNKFLATFQAMNFATGRLDNILFTNNYVETLNNASGNRPAVQMTADSSNAPSNNVVVSYNTITGGRLNWDYLEGVPICFSACTGAITAGNLAAGSYFPQVIFSLNATPAALSATDGVGSSSTIASGTTGKITIPLPADPNYKYNIFCGTTSTAANVATVTAVEGTGVDGLALAGGQTIIITACSSTTVANPHPTVGHNELKTAFSLRFNLTDQFNIKSDTYNASGSVNNGARIGGWEGRYAGRIGNVFQQGTAIGLCPTDSLSGLGDALGYLENYNPACSTAVGSLGWIVYKSYRGWGGANAIATAPALNIGQGNICLDVSSVTHPINLVPTGLAQYPTDGLGRARLNNGSGAGGFAEQGCI